MFSQLKKSMQILLQIHQESFELGNLFIIQVHCIMLVMEVKLQQQCDLKTRG
jgi:hypothetical protein